MECFVLKYIISFCITILLLGSSMQSFAYSKNVERKIQSIETKIEKEKTKIQKIDEKKAKNSRKTISTSDTHKKDKIQEKIMNYQEQINTIKAAEDKKIKKDVDAIEKRIKQSSQRITNLEASEQRRIALEKKRFDNKVKLEQSKDIGYKAPAFVPSPSPNKNSMDIEKAKIEKYKEEIEQIRNPKSSRKSNK